jgi:hypothetical protein
MQKRTITNGQALTPTLVPAGSLQRQCHCGNNKISAGECNGCSKNRESVLQRAAINHTSVSRHDVPPIVHEVLNSPGQPLDASARAFFEPRFGNDFSKVRVHVDGEAAKSARSVNALAYTVGQNLVFDSQQYAPQTAAGRRLIAHELTHVIQQRFQTSLSPNAVSRSDSAQEAEAEAIANTVNSGAMVPELLSSPSDTKGVLQRSNGDGDKSRQSKPRDAPRGTLPIDETGLDREDVHKIKDGIGAGPRDWVGITPDGDVISSDSEGNSENHGPASDYLRISHPEIPSWVWTLVGFFVVVAIIACFATGVCEVAAVIGGLGYAAALLIMGLLETAGIRDSGVETAANEQESEPPDQVA